MRGLTKAAAPDLAFGLAGVGAVLDRRLDPASRAPLAVGVSGGGDSLALLILTLDWARSARRPVVALTVDHRLHPDSGRWTEAALAAATRLGAAPHALAWTSPKPVAGLPAAARDARHRLLADAARAAGAEVLLLGHTADDLAEAAAMRAEGSSVGDPRQWSPSPVWPEGRGLFLLRPLLGAARSELRALLRGRGETWFDDPANDDLRFARARARSNLTDGARRSPPLPRADAALTRLAAACLCAAGHDRPPRRERVEALAKRLAGPGRLAATLAGARVEADDREVRFTRELGHGLPEIALPPGESVVWDGRYEITSSAPGLTVRALAGLARRLPAAERAALARIPAFARPTLPALVDAGGAVSCPILARRSDVRVVPLALGRFAAACGLIGREGESGDPARGETEHGVLSWTRP